MTKTRAEDELTRIYEKYKIHDKLLNDPFFEECKSVSEQILTAMWNDIKEAYQKCMDYEAWFKGEKKGEGDDEE